MEKKIFTVKDKNLTKADVAEALGIKVTDIEEATVSHTYDLSNILEVGQIYEYSTYQITTK
ncbi:MAG: hypothetical protein KH100_06055 [Dysgonomonas mossii]|uniref:hypothetical protein n=1 Tax=Dysgonomonas mossii TaxID=163665 RepID=UPI001DAE4843|nr:hypothetical protein [Dysgonomonas mossii]MBS5797356.1 hypothetical protein [Dysgonomonas mossii]MBS7110750.1 hypothetical protein [Dysgonomonas mossii]